MISLEAIENEIMELEKKDTSYAVIERLSWLYICRDHLKSDIIAEPEPVSLSSTGSDFLDAMNGTQLSEALTVLNEHMESIKALFPQEYSSLVNRLNRLKS